MFNVPSCCNVDQKTVRYLWTFLPLAKTCATLPQVASDSYDILNNPVTIKSTLGPQSGMLLTEWLFHMLLSEFLTALIQRRRSTPGILAIYSPTVGFYHLSHLVVIHTLCTWSPSSFVAVWEKTVAEVGVGGIDIRWQSMHCHCFSVIPSKKWGPLPLPVHPHGLTPETIAITWSLFSDPSSFLCSGVFNSSSLRSLLGSWSWSRKRLNEIEWINNSYLWAFLPQSNVEPGRGHSWWQWHLPS